MAYNLQSLITILQGILDPQQTRWILGPQKPQLQSLLQKASSLQQILEKTPPLTKIPSLECQIRDVANEAEDIVESHMVERIFSMHLECQIRDEANESYMLERLFSMPEEEEEEEEDTTPDVLLVTQKLDSVIEQVVKLVEVERNKKPTGSSWSGDGASFSSVVVAVDEDLKQLKDRLIGMQSKLEILPIVGMGGIGKTTLARTLYQDPLILDHFSNLAWTTISQDYNMRSILLSLLQCIIGKEECDKHKEKGDSDLKDILYRSLYGRRYMIVLDDIWSTTFWDEIRRYFPDNNNGSRIVITTRESDVAKYADSEIQHHHQVKLLSESQSWDLLSQIVFGEEECPHELQGIGEKIASDCGGLPLAINVIGGLLSKVERLKDVWENIGNDARAAIAESDKQFSNILSLSYNHLPLHLKPCFLYMAAFPEDYEIDPLRLICMWVAEGFVKSNGDKSFEEEAEDYLRSLVERNLVSVITSYDWYGETERYNMHDLLRDLCIRKADDEKFLHVKNSTFSNQLLRRVSIHTSYGMDNIDEYASSSEMSLVRSFLLFVKLVWNISPMVFTLRLLRVLDLLEMNKYYKIEFSEEILQLVNLRYLSIDCESLPRSGISRLCNLQTLIAQLSDYSYCPAELWEMSELRHLIILGPSYLRIEDDYMKKIVLKKLQTIRGVELSPSVIRRGFLESIPNIKNLEIRYEVEGSSGMSEVVDLSHLHKLQTLSWSSLRVPKFPSTLRELSLWNCVITPAATTALCALPNLEVLKMSGCTFKSNETEEEEEANEEWEIAEGDEFRSLQFLQLYGCYRLVRWRADETNFPRLRHLIIDWCRKLEEIPAGIGEIPTLQLIHLEDCNDSAVASAKQIQEEQQSEYENYQLQLRISNS